MGKLVLVDAFVTVNAVDLSDHLESVEIEYGARLQDVTSMADLTEIMLPGLLHWTITLNFRQDFSAAEPDETLFPLVGAAAFVTAVRATSAVASATNPEFLGTGVLESYNPLGQAVGETAMAPVVIRSAGALARIVT